MVWLNAVGKDPSRLPTVNVPDWRNEYVPAAGGLGGSGVAGSRAPTSGLALGHCCTGGGGTSGRPTTGPDAGSTTGTGASGNPGCTGGGAGLAGVPLSRMSVATSRLPTTTPCDGAHAVEATAMRSRTKARARVRISHLLVAGRARVATDGIARPAGSRATRPSAAGRR